MRDEVKIATVITVLMLGLGALVAWVSAQEQQYVTRKWRVAVVDSGDGYSKAKVDVIDTEGVCLYIAHEFTNDRIAITAVPKTSLRPGVGCQ